MLPNLSDVCEMLPNVANVAKSCQVMCFGRWQAVAKKPSGALMEILKGKPRINRHLVYNPQEMSADAASDVATPDSKIWSTSNLKLIFKIITNSLVRKNR